MSHNAFTKVVVPLLFCVFGSLAYGQGAQVQGQVLDPAGAAVAKAHIRAVDQATSVEHTTESNATGQYAVPGLTPGQYIVYVEAPGFSTSVSNVITLNVAQNAVLDFNLKVGAAASEVTVDAGNITVNTTDAAVSTVIDRQFVENLPLNGRSFQSLLYMTPGINLNVAGTTNPNGGSGQGQFVVNGQRGDQNYWMVDGVSGNINMTAWAGLFGTAGAGATGGTNALGGTSSLVSVDAMQEFRVETSTYAPEFGRGMGGQISIQTRSGTNQFHGALFEYLRNTDLDAEDWFAEHEGLRKAGEIQNDFGGVLGGPIVKDKTFFFFSAEDLRLLLPSTMLGMVPSLAARKAAIPATQPYLNVFPLPIPQSVPLAGVPGWVTYSAAFSQPDSAGAYSLRLDHQLLKNLNLFARYSYAPSETVQRGSDSDNSNGVWDDKTLSKTATAGATWAKSAQVVNDLRLNYSFAGGTVYNHDDNFGGGTACDACLNLIPNGFTPLESRIVLGFLFGAVEFFSSNGREAKSIQGHYNAIDTLSVLRGAHSLKFGVDYRRMSPTLENPVYELIPLFFSPSQIETGVAGETVPVITDPTTFLTHNLSVFGQDTWRVNSRLNLTYGLRWDVDYVPTAEDGPNPVAVTGFSLSNYSNLALAPKGTSFYNTRYGNVAPRIGGAYRLLTDPDLGLVLRGGFGVFYGLSSDQFSVVYGSTYPYGSSGNLFNTPFPTPASQLLPPPISIPTVANGQTLIAFDPHINLPYGLEWNVSLEQSLGRAQSLSLSYIGASDRRLLANASITSPNSSFAFANLWSDVATSSYQAFQVKFQRGLFNGLQSLISYTWAHSIDDGSYGAYANGGLADVNANRGDSDYDLRHVFTAAVTYNAPAWKRDAVTRAITGGWSTDNIVQARTGPPIDVQDGSFTALSYSKSSVLIRPDVVPGQPKYLSGSQYPGRKAMNPAYFTNPPVNPATNLPTRQGDLGRNAFRALGLAQWDFAAHREFPIHERLKLQFRAELFNILNHPNFGPFNNQFEVSTVFISSSNPYFGMATQMLNQYLGGLEGDGNQNPLYTPGSPRSGELALKLTF